MLFFLLKLLPVFILILIGYGSGKAKIINRSNAESLVKYLYYIAIPCLLFNAISSNPDFLQQVSLAIFAGYFIPTAGVLVVSCYLLKVVAKRPAADSCIYAFSITFSNVVMLGIPATQLLFDKQSISNFLTILSCHALILVSLLVLMLELGKSNQTGSSTNRRIRAAQLSFPGNSYFVLQSMVKTIVNPLVAALILGFGFSLLNIRMPELLTAVFTAISSSVAPVGLITLGASLYSFGLTFANRGDLLITILIAVGKLLLMPAIVFAFTHFYLQLPAQQVILCSFIAALPTGNNAFIFAHRYRTNITVPTSAIFITSVLAVITLPTILALLATFFNQ